MLHMPTPMLMGGLQAVPVGQQLILSGGIFTVPSGVTNICVACMEAGQNGSYEDPNFITGYGGSLRWVNAIAVTPGENLGVTVVGPTMFSRESSLSRSGTALCRAANSPVGAGFLGGSGALYEAGMAGPFTGGGAARWTANGPLSYEGDALGGSGTSPYGAIYPAAASSVGATYGGGGGPDAPGGAGFVYIIWGPGRAFPLTNTGAL